LCDGSEISRIDYAALFSQIGTYWGAGDGSTTFNLPDMRNRVPLGSGTFPYASRGGAIPIVGGVIGYAAVNFIIKQ
jgi:microcystin-dependent protein